MNAALQCEQVSKRFGDVQAVDKATVEVPAGALLALLGPSGCGKTTMLRAIAGLETPDEGSINIYGHPVFSAKERVPPERRMVGLVFQDYALFPHLDVSSNVGFGLSRTASRNARIEHLLTQVGLKGMGRRMPYELSGGQQQRVALARALAPNPRLVLLDEPFSNLDASLRVELRVEVRDILRRAGATAVFVTHDQEEALSLADVVAVMIDGRILQTAPPAEIYRWPATRAVAEFVGDANVIPGQGIGRAVVCALGTVAIPNPMIGQVDVLVRPEALQLTRDPNGQAVVGFRRFYGHDQMVTVTFDSGLSMDCRVGPGFDLPVGDRVRAQLTGHVQAFLRQGIAPGRDPRSPLVTPMTRSIAHSPENS